MVLFTKEYVPTSVRVNKVDLSCVCNIGFSSFSYLKGTKLILFLLTLYLVILKI